MDIYNQHRLREDLGMSFDTERMERDGGVVVNVDCDVAYPQIQSALAERVDNGKYGITDQYTAEVVRRCLVTRCQDVFHPTADGGPLTVHLTVADKAKSKWVLKNMSSTEGRTAEDGAREFQPAYDEIAEALF